MKTISQAAKENTSIEVKDGSDNDALFINRIGMRQLLDRTFTAGADFTQRWIPVEEELPGSQKKVLVKVRLKNNNEIETTAIYIPSKTVLASDFLDDYSTDDLQEYDESIDDYWTKEGWFEWHYYSEVNYLIHDEIIGWRPLNYEL